jgi:hypothetical protein
MDFVRRYPHRFALEWRAMAELFPGFRFVGHPRPMWIGMLTVRHFNQTFVVRYEYTPEYPDELPKLFVMRPALPRNTPHVYADGSVCVHPESAPRDLWAPPASLALCQAWLFKFSHWQATGRPWHRR